MNAAAIGTFILIIVLMKAIKIAFERIRIRHIRKTRIKRPLKAPSWDKILHFPEKSVLKRKH